MRGQSEAPIELLIGVTILTFVLIVASYVFNSSCAVQQENKLQVSFSQLSRDLNSVYFGSIDSSILSRVDFSVSQSCMSYTIDSVRVAKGSPDTCREQLGKNDCYVLLAMTNSPDYTGQRFMQVLDVSQDTKIINKIDPSSCTKALGEIAYDSADASYSKCWFESREYVLRITKTASDTIEIRLG